MIDQTRKFEPQRSEAQSVGRPREVGPPLSIESLIVLLLTQLVVSLLGTWMVGRWAARGHLLDVPNDRSSHHRPTPRGGGLAIVLVFVASMIYLYALGLASPDVMISFAGSVMIAGIGLYDDVRPLQARIRLLVQMSAAMLAIGMLLWTGPVAARGFLSQGMLFLGWVAALVWATNLFNFMDGIDGLAASEAIFLASAAALIFHQFNLPSDLQLVALTVAAATAGFLVLNWSPASIFMGDVGSAFLGFALALTGMYASYRFAIPIEVWVILSGVFFVDATLTLLVRAFRRQNPAKAHRSHAYQHLALSRGHRASVLWVSVINVFWLLPWAFAAAHFPSFSFLCLVLALTPLVAGALHLRAGQD